MAMDKEEAVMVIKAHMNRYHICDVPHSRLRVALDMAISALRKDPSEVVKVETNFYDHEEIYPDCTAQVLTNTATGEVSVGWWKNETD